MYKIKTLDILGTVLETEFFMSQPDMASVQRQAVSKWGKGVVVRVESERYIVKNTSKNSSSFSKTDR